MAFPYTFGWSAAGPKGFKAFDASDGIRTGLLLALTGLVILAPVTWPDQFAAGATVDAEQAWLSLALLIGGLFVANMARMLAIWKRLKPAVAKRKIDRSPDERSTANKGFRELFVYVFIVLIVSTILTFSAANGGPTVFRDLRLLEIGTIRSSDPQLATLLGTLALSFVPLLIAFLLLSRTEQASFDREVFRSDSISVSSFYLGGLLFGLIVALALWASHVSQTQQDGLGENLAFFITFGVVSLFVALIFLPHILRYLDFLVEAERDPRADKPATPFVIGALPAGASWIDSVLVRLIAPLTGATQNGPMVPHSFVLLSILPLTALGFVLPQPWGLGPICLGVLMVLALGRRWAWIEEDRETASRLLQTDTSEVKVGFDNDLKDEALLGYACLFILVPLALHQINGIAGAFQGAGGTAIDRPFFAWLSFFGGELAKAVPFVDWWEIYNVSIKAPVEGVCAPPGEQCLEGNGNADIVPAAKHLTFAARAVVDLVIMAALFQAIGIWQRSRTQEALYDAGQIDAFDPFTEERFFRRGMRNRNAANGNRSQSGNRPYRTFGPRLKFQERIENHVKKRVDRGLREIPYNERRLGELLRHPDQEVREGAEWMVEYYGLLAGTPLERLKQLADDWRVAWYEGNARHDQPIKKLDAEGRSAWRRSEKLRLEPLLDELLHSRRGVYLTKIKKEDVANLVQVIAISGDEVEFGFSRILIVEILENAHDPAAIWSLAAQVLPRMDEFDVWAKEIETMFGVSSRDEAGQFVSLRFGRQEPRARVYKAIRENALGYENDDPTIDNILDLLKKIRTTRKAEAKSISGPALRKTIESLAGASFHDDLIVDETEQIDVVEDEEDI